MRLRLPRHWKRLLFLPPVAAGVVVLGYRANHRVPPREVAASEPTRTLRTIRVPEVIAMPRAVGYGVAEPGRTWRAIAEVKGRVVEVHPDLQSGGFARAGDLLVRIDPTDYELAVEQLEAALAQLDARLAEIDAREANLRATLAIERDSLELSLTELERLEAVAASGEGRAISKSTVDKERRSYLAQQGSVVAVESSLRLVPSERASAEADRRGKEVALAAARRDVERTRLVAPFDGRLSEVDVEVDQFVAAGQSLLVAHDLATTEVEAQIPVERMRNFVAEVDPGTSLTNSEFLRGVEAVVRFQAGDVTIEWDARAVRGRELLDPATRTIGIVVAVDEPYERAIPGVRPPLVGGMFCEVELRRSAPAAHPVVPRLALRSEGFGPFVYVRDGAGRLARRDVELVFDAGGFASVASGIAPGEELVVSDPTPAVLGMLIDPVDDPAALEALVREATGAGALR